MNPDLQLRDIHLPPEIGLWPPAPGWWGLVIVLALALFALFRWWGKRTPVRRNQVLLPALQELERIERTYQHDPHALVRELSVLLRRIAISLHGRQQVAGLTGSAWLQFLDQQRSVPVFSSQFQQALTELPYRRNGSADAPALIHEVRQWLRSQQEGSKHV